MDFSRTHYTGHGYFSDPVISAITAVAFVLFMVVIISWWKMFTKAGEKGWKALIPIYNFYLACKLFSHKWHFFVLLPVVIIDEIFNELYMWVYIVPRPICMLICFITTVLIIVIGYCFHANVAKSFGRGRGFAVLLLFFPLFVYPIIAFENNEYLGNATKLAKK